MAKCTLLLTVILAFWIACSLASPRKHKKPKHGRHGKEGGNEKGGDCKQTEHGKACTIPFKYKGVSYTECTRIDEPRPWCATSVKSNGEYRTYQYCSNQCAMPVDGSLSPWSQWGICSASCGPGAQQRTRACDPAEHGGKPCDDERLQTRNCQVKPCPDSISRCKAWSVDPVLALFSKMRSWDPLPYPVLHPSSIWREGVSKICWHREENESPWGTGNNTMWSQGMPRLIENLIISDPASYIDVNSKRGKIQEPNVSIHHKLSTCNWSRAL